MEQNSPPAGVCLEQGFVDLTVKYVEELIRFDEVEKALLVLDNVPSYFKDLNPPELTSLKREIISALCTPSVYLDDDRDSNVDKDAAVFQMHKLLRANLLLKDVQKLNDKGVTPHLVDMGPGDYYLPIGLKELGCKFTYHPLSMNNAARKLAEPHLDGIIDLTPNIDRPKIFICNEVIEHLPHVTDIATNCAVFAGQPDYIHLSTPCYTYDPAKKDWKKRGGLPHLRTYSENTFHAEAVKLFPGYFWQLYRSPIASLRGIRNDIEDKSGLLS